jgi:hypothetical protein
MSDDWTRCPLTDDDEVKYEPSGGSCCKLLIIRPNRRLA